MSGKTAREARQSGSNKSGQNTKAAKNTRNVKNSKNAKVRKDAAAAAAAAAAKKKKLNTAIWVSAVVVVVAFLVTALILVLNDDKKPGFNSGNNSENNGNNGNENAVEFSYSNGIAENGFWEGIRALDFVTLFYYQALPIPKSVHELSNGVVYSEIYSLIEGYTLDATIVLDRAVVDGDRVNIDFIGSVDGVEFENGSTGGIGTDITAGSKEYISDFLTQIIGRMPGETFNIYVTFPENYGQDHLNGKDAVFVTTVNYIIEYEITDEFIAQNFSEEHGWKTVDEMKEIIKKELNKTAIEDYVKEFLDTEANRLSTPAGLLDYQEKLIINQEKEMLDYYQEYADMYGMELDDFLQVFVGVSSKDDLIEQIREYAIRDLKLTLIVQAIAEDANISVSNADLEKYLPDYSSLIEQFGLPYLKQHVLGLKIKDYIIENAVLVW